MKNKILEIIERHLTISSPPAIGGIEAAAEAIAAHFAEVEAERERLKAENRMLIKDDNTHMYCFTEWRDTFNNLTYKKRQNADLIAENRRLKEALNADRWTPVSEGLPKEIGEYLVTYNGGKLGQCRFEGYWQAGSNNVIAWRPTSAPYEGEGQ